MQEIEKEERKQCKFAFQMTIHLAAAGAVTGKIISINKNAVRSEGLT